jgi:4-hydroxy-tetrahydrodipicolinate synthase
MNELKGICVPICTPFKNGGASLDVPGLEAHIDSMLEAKVHILAVNGGTGEFPFLTEAEKRQIAEVAAKRIDGRAKLIVQTSALRTEDAVANPATRGESAPMRCLYFHILRVRKICALALDALQNPLTPIMVYNIPQSRIDTRIYSVSVRDQVIKYIKDSTANNN